jgi:hypothetical protein
MTGIIEVAEEQQSEQKTTTTQWHRDHWKALVNDAPRTSRSRFSRAWRAVGEIAAELRTGENPAFVLGHYFDKHQRGWAINMDVYGVGFHEGRPLGVIQVRKWEKRRKNGFASVRKTYFLVGRNEKTSLPFAHPVESRVVHAAIRKDPAPEAVIRAVCRWIFQVTSNQAGVILRQGDVALVPAKGSCPSNGEVISDHRAGLQVADSHVLEADQIVKAGDRIYAKNPRLRHLKRQHRQVSGSGWFRVQLGRRAHSWSFARPTTD